MPQIGSLPCDQPDHVWCLHSSRFPTVQGLPSGLLLKGLLGKKWKGLAHWFKSPIPTDPGLKWGNYCQVIPRCQDRCWTGEGGFPGPEPSNHYRPSQVGADEASWLDRFSRNWNTWAWYSYNIKHLCSIHTLKKSCLQIKPGSSLYMAMEFHLTFLFQNKLYKKLKTIKNSTLCIVVLKTTF